MLFAFSNLKMTKELRVLHIEDRFHPSMGYQINFFAKYHAPEIDFHILTSDSLSIWQGLSEDICIDKLDKQFEQKYAVKIHRLKTKWGETQKSNLWLKGLIKKINEINPDVIYVHVIESYSAIRIILNSYLRRKKIRIFTDTHTLYNQFIQNIGFKLHLAFLKTVIRKIIVKKNIRVFATTIENQKILSNNYGIPIKNIDFLPIGTDSNQFFFSESDRLIERQNLNISPKDVVLLYTGKINERKEPHLILKAVEKIASKIKCNLHIIFIGPKIEPYFNLNFQLDFFNKIDHIRIQFINQVENSYLYRYYSMADFAVFPKENTLSALDAQACRLPVIMEADSTNNKRLEKGGLVYKKDNINDLGSKISYLTANEKLRSKLSLEGQQFILENYEYKRIIKKFEDLITAK